MELSINTRQAYSEVDELLDLITVEEKNAIPKKLRDFFKEEKDPSYHKNINANVAIKEQNLKKETLAIMASLYLKYWCKDEKEKQELLMTFAENEEKHQRELREKYNPDNIFKNNNITNELQNESEDTSLGMQIVEYKEPILKRIINRVLEFLHLK